MDEKLKKLREFVWLQDVPHPTVPEYIELHNKIQAILGEIDKLILDTQKVDMQKTKYQIERETYSVKLEDDEEYEPRWDGQE